MRMYSIDNANTENQRITSLPHSIHAILFGMKFAEICKRRICILLLQIEHRLNV